MMDLTKVKRIYTTHDYHQANMLLRCNWILLEVNNGRFVLGQTEKFRCPSCDSEIAYDKVQISSWEGLHIVECPMCGEQKIPYGLTIDQYFVDKMTAYGDEDLCKES
jgi:Zn ribbon nucleic-acid-binding protein